MSKRSLATVFAPQVMPVIFRRPYAACPETPGSGPVHIGSSHDALELTAPLTVAPGVHLPDRSI
jgi:hypothetical protein